MPLPFHHRDPFDRLLIAQAQVEQIPLISVDSAFDAYSIPRIWRKYEIGNFHARLLDEYSA